jgi:hypothetical protein
VSGTLTVERRGGHKEELGVGVSKGQPLPIEVSLIFEFFVSLHGFMFCSRL